MATDGRLWVRLAGLSAFIAVLAGAFAAHWINDPQAKELLRTGSSYQILHALAALACVAIGPGLAPRAAAPALFLLGSTLFSGSLYAMGLGAPRWVGIVTPFGGLCFLAGWLTLAITAGRAAGRPGPTAGSETGAD